MLLEIVDPYYHRCVILFKVVLASFVVIALEPTALDFSAQIRHVLN